MTKFILDLALFLPSGQLRQIEALSPPLTLRQCEDVKGDHAVRVSYLVDFWNGRGSEGEPVLVCVEVAKK